MSFWGMCRNVTLNLVQVFWGILLHNSSKMLIQVQHDVQMRGGA